MKIRRDIASIPVRSAKDTWRTIVELVTGGDSIDKQQLDDAASVMESIIADEWPAAVPIVFKGVGPRVLVCCLYNEDAIEAGRDVDALNSNPTAGDWRVTAPCEKEDTDWMNKTLKSRAPRLSVHAADEEPLESDTQGTGETTKGLEIDWGGLSTL